MCVFPFFIFFITLFFYQFSLNFFFLSFSHFLLFKLSSFFLYFSFYSLFLLILFLLFSLFFLLIPFLFPFLHLFPISSSPFLSFSLIISPFHYTFFFITFTLFPHSIPSFSYFHSFSLPFPFRCSFSLTVHLFT